MSKILLLDNYDSFTYNLYQYLQQLGQKVIVKRNDQIDCEEIARLSPARIVISPGPGRPEKAGIVVVVIKSFYDKIPILGVCLGHQALAYAFGARIIRAKNIMHGKTSLIYHKKTALYHNIPNPFVATRYHSLIVDRTSLPSILEIDAYTQEGEIMGLHLRGLPVFGIQYHPESILTTEGMNILRNFLKA